MLQQTEQPMATELAGKMLRCQASAAVRLQAAGRGLLARRRVRKMRDLPLIQPCTYLQLHHVEDCDLIRCVGDFQIVVPLTGSVHAVFSRGWTQSLRRRQLEALCSSMCGADQQPSSGEKAWCHRWERFA